MALLISSLMPFLTSTWPSRALGVIVLMKQEGAIFETLCNSQITLYSSLNFYYLGLGQ